MTELELLRKKLQRERLARNEAEAILEKKALELYEASTSLKIFNKKLKDQIGIRTLELLQSENKYRSMIENMDLGILEVDTAGVIINAYDKFCQLTGYTKEELIGKNASKLLVSPKHKDTINREDEIRKGGKSSVYEIQIIKKNGDPVWVLISGAPFYDKDGKIAGSVGMHYDISKTKRLQLELHKAKIKAEKAHNAEKLFLANMSHEIRTPLNAVVGMTHLLNDTGLNKEQREYVDIIMNSSHLLLNLISDILDISKIDSGNIEVNKKPFDLHWLISKIIKSYTLKTKETGVQIHMDFDASIDTLLIHDDLLINQVLMNLVSNAVKFTDEGSVTIRVKCIEKVLEKITLLFEVEDTGIGLTENQILQIFQQFKQANNSISKEFGGTGLGLSICKKILNLLGSTIEVKSAIGKGSTFFFKLNVEKSNEKLSDTPQLGKAMDTNQLILDNEILIVEDNQVNQKYIIGLLNKWSLPFILANNGQEAIELASKSKFDLILMDLQMPIVDGFEATKSILTKGLNMDTPIIALTASTFLSKKQLALEIGMRDFLSKPFTPIQLKQLIEKHLLSTGDQKQSNQKGTNFIFSSHLESNYLEEMYGGDIDYALELFGMFLETIPQEIQLLDAAISTKNTKEIKRLCHKIHPTFSLVGLSDLAKKAKELDVHFDEHDEVHQLLKAQSIQKQFKDQLGIIILEVEKMKEYVA